MSGTNLPVCAGQISPLVDELFISGTLMFEGLPWPKKIYSLILNLCHSDLSGYSSMLLHVCVRARLHMQADSPAVSPAPSLPPFNNSTLLLLDTDGSSARQTKQNLKIRERPLLNERAANCHYGFHRTTCCFIDAVGSFRCHFIYMF